MAESKIARFSTIISLHSLQMFCVCPNVCFDATILCCSVSDEIKLARPSKCIRSFLPLINALFENSPGNANLHPIIFSRFQTFY